MRNTLVGVKYPTNFQSHANVTTSKKGEKLYVKFVTPDGGNTINGYNNSSRALPHY